MSLGGFPGLGLLVPLVDGWVGKAKGEGEASEGARFGSEGGGLRQGPRAFSFLLAPSP